MIFAFFIICFYLVVFSQERLPYDVTTANQVVLINSDEDELSQAMLLIDMLKTDYLKQLRQNYEVAENVTAIVEQSTCAAATGLENEMSGSTLNPTIATLSTTTPIVPLVPHEENRVPTPNKDEAAWQEWHPPMVHAAPMYPLRWADHGTTSVYSYTMPLYDAPNPSRQQPGPVRPPLRPWRRFFSDSFFYDVHPLRFPKFPPNRRADHPTTLRTTRSTIAQKTATTERPTKSTKSIKRTPSTSSSKATWNSLRTSNGHTLRQRPSKKAPFQKKTSPYIQNTDPVEAEVASELLKEFKLINITPNTKMRKTVAVVSTSTE